MKRKPLLVVAILLAAIYAADAAPLSGAEKSKKAARWEEYRKLQVCNETGIKRLTTVVRYSNNLLEAQLTNDKLHECNLCI